MSGTTTTNVPPLYIGAQGVQLPTEASILAGVFADLQAAFGGSLSTLLGTPQGQLAQSLTAIIGDKNSAFLLLASMFDPAFNEGRFQDAIARIYYLYREGGTGTLVQVQFFGPTGTPVPTGTSFTDNAGYTYSTSTAATIPESGVVTVPAVNTTLGPLPCPPQTFSLNPLIPGVESVSSTAAGVLGTTTENSVQFETRRAASVAVNGQQSLISLRGAILSLSGVIDCYVTENSTTAPVTIQNVQIAANSVYICVAGGSSTQIAQAILQKKAPGISMTGNTTVAVPDPTTNYAPPVPTWNVTYQTAVAVTVFVQVTIRNSNAVPNDAAIEIVAPVLAAFSGTDGYTSQTRIGLTIYASRFYAGIQALGTWAEVVNIKIGTTATPTADYLVVDLDAVPSISAASISLVLA